MSIDEIIQALKYCADKDLKCEKCSLYDEDDAFTCSSKLKLEALDLINRQQAENNKLKYQVNRLKEYDERRDIALHSKLMAETKAKAIKEFAKRVKSYLQQVDFGTPDERWKPESEFATLIDNLVKEMVGEDDV